MGKNRKAHRKKIKARNSQKKAQQNQVLKYIKDQGLTPQEMLAKIQKGEVKVKDEQVFGPKATELKSVQHTTMLTQSLPVATGDGLVDFHTGLSTPYNQVMESGTKNPRDTQ